MFILLIAVSAVCILISLVRLGYMNWIPSKLQFKQAGMHSGWDVVTGRKNIKKAIKHARKHGWEIVGGNDNELPIKDVVNGDLSYTNVRYPGLSATVDYDNRELTINFGEPKIIKS